MLQSSLSPFFNPQGIAVIGASQDPIKLGYGLARNLVQSNYQGGIHFVNPRGGKLFGKPVFPTVNQVPDPVDLGIILIPAPAVPGAIRQCGERGIRAIILASGGFRETGEAGAALEAECLRVAAQFGIRLMGPNCIGLLDTHLPLDATFLPPPGPLPGDVAFISHSGAICAAVIDWARGQGFGLSRLVSLGNQADVNETDVLAPVAADPFTRVLTLYLEGVTDGRRFVREASQVSRQKPVLALKVGRYASAKRAVASHTGALAGQENAFNAAFQRAGVIRVDTSEELFDWARALAWCPPPRGRSIAVLTNAGGPGVTAVDALEANHMQITDLQAATRAALAELLPPAASLNNPVDMLASASPEQYAACLRLLLRDEGVHGVLVILPPPPMHTAGAVAKALIPVIHSADKPVVIALMGERLIQEAVEHFRAAHIAEYRFPERAASAMAVLAERSEYLIQLAGQHPPVLQVDAHAVRQILDRSAIHSGFLEQDVICDILAAYQIPTPTIRLAHTAEEAIEAFHHIQAPVAVKLASPDLPHKSDVGGVLLNLRTEAEIRHGFTSVIANGRAKYPQAVIQGAYIQAMLPMGQDVIIGAIQDAQFGPLAMFGSGGVEVEGLKDVAFGLAPLNVEEAGNMLDSTWAGNKLRGYRNLPPADRQAAIQTLLRLAQLAVDFPEFLEIEINPLRIFTEQQGVMALDARIRL